jgi:RIO kinase 1
MRIPESLATLFDYGILEDVVRPLMSGKEAQIYLVVSGGKYCVAKVYKEAQNRSFKHRAEYTEGRKVRNSRDQRAIQKRSKHGRAQDEAAWRSTEVDIIHRLQAAGVRVPVPQAFIDGVLLMELITDADGNPAPRLADLVFDPDSARAMYERLLREVVRMLCAGVVHGDLSDFNVLVGADGPVIIDFPQSVDTAHNTNARRLLLRDVDNLHRFLSQFVPHARRLPYAEEMWDLFQQNAITPETRLTGRYRPSERRANTHAVLELIQDANYDERKRRESLGVRGGPPAGGASPGGPRRREPARTPPPRQGPQPPNAPRGGPPQPAAARGPRPHASGGRRDGGRPIEVIIAHRRPTPR